MSERSDSYTVKATRASPSPPLSFVSKFRLSAGVPRCGHAPSLIDVLTIGFSAALYRCCPAPSVTNVLIVGFCRGLATSLPRAVVHPPGPRRLPPKSVARAAERNALVISSVVAARFPWDGGRVEVRRLVLAYRF